MTKFCWPRGSECLAWLTRQRSSPKFAVITVAVAGFTDIFLYSVIVPVLPFALSERIGVPKDEVQYWTSASLAVFAAANLVSGPTWGYLADRMQNRRTPMLLGLSFLLGASLFLCFATTIPLLLIGRALQGMSAAMVWSVGMALVVGTVDSGSTGQALGWIGSAVNVGMLVAPMVGGQVYAKFGYFPVFWLCFGLIGFDVVLRLGLVEKKKEAKNTGHNSAAAPSRDDTETTPLIISHPSSSSSSPSTTQKSIGLTQLLTNTRLLAALFGTTIETIIQTSFDSTLPLFVSSAFGWDARGAGLIFLPLVIPSTLGPLAGAISDRYGSKWPATIGFLVGSPLLICLRFVQSNGLLGEGSSSGSFSDKALLCVLLAGIGFSMTFVFGPLMAEVTWAIQEASGDFEEVPYGLAYGMHSCAFSIGAIFGPIMAGSIKESYGWPAMTLALGIMAGTSAVVPAIWVGGSLQVKKGDDRREGESNEV